MGLINFRRFLAVGLLLPVVVHVQGCSDSDFGNTVVSVSLKNTEVYQYPAAGGDEEAIAKVRSAYQTAAGAQDAAGVAKLYAADGEELPPNAPAAKGRAAIEKYHKDFAAQFMMHGITITSTALHVSGAWAIDVGTYKQTLMVQKGGAMIDDKGKYIVVLKKSGANWEIAHAMYNSDIPMPAPPAKK